MKKIFLYIIYTLICVDFYGQTDIDWDNIVEFRIVKRSNNSMYFIDSSCVDTISIRIDLNDVKKVLKNTVIESNKKNFEFRNYSILGQIIFSNGEKRFLKIADLGFKDITSNMQYSIKKHNKEWCYFRFRVPLQKKDSIIEAFKRNMTSKADTIESLNMHLPVYSFCNIDNDEIDFFLINLTNEDVNYFERSDIVPLNVIGFLAKLDRCDNKKCALDALKEIINYPDKRLYESCLKSRSVSLAAYCLKLLEKKHISLNYELSRKEIKTLKKEIKHP